MHRYVYIYIYIHIHTHTHTYKKNEECLRESVLWFEKMDITIVGLLFHPPTVHAFRLSSRDSDYGTFSNCWIVDAEDGNGGFIIL